MNIDTASPPADVVQALHRLSGKEQSALLSYIVSLQSRDDAAARRRRRTWILECIEYLPRAPPARGDNSRNLNFWRNNLTEEERNDAGIVYKMLEHESIHEIFGADPWSKTYNPDRECELSSGFSLDPQAFIAFTRSADFGSSITEVYEVPMQFRDDFSVMKAACSRTSACFQYASPRLKDDEEFVRSIAFKEEHSVLVTVRQASERLKNNASFITNLLEDFCSKYSCEQKKYAWYWLGYLLPGPFNRMELEGLLKLIPPMDLPSAIGNFPESLRDDIEIMMQLMNRVEPSKTGAIYECCSERVQHYPAVIEAVKKNLGDEYFLESSRYAYIKAAKIVALEKIAANEAKCLDAIPWEMRFDRDVIESAIEHGILHDRDSVLSFIKDVGGLGFVDETVDEFYEMLPQDIQDDEAIALAFILQLKCSFALATFFFAKLPSLSQSKKVLCATWRLYRSDCAISQEPDEFLSKCPSHFFKDKEFMFAAVHGNEFNIGVTSEKLLSDREFMLAVSELPNATFICFAAPAFQTTNLDLVRKAIDNISICNACHDWFFQNVTPDVWTDRSVVMKWLTQDRETTKPFLSLLKEVDPESIFLNDREVVALAVHYNSSDLANASDELRDDRKFVLQLVKKYDRALQHAAKEFWFDEDVVLAAMAKDVASIVDCFDILQSRRDEEFLLELSLKVRLKLYLHDTFVQGFLHGTVIYDQHTRHPSVRCHLPKLDRGTETSIDFKRLIADFVGAPVGEDYVRYKNASLALKRFGFY